MRIKLKDESSLHKPIVLDVDYVKVLIKDNTIDDVNDIENIDGVLCENKSSNLKVFIVAPLDIAFRIVEDIYNYDNVDISKLQSANMIKDVYIFDA